ncbi:PTS sugar transporter subunit IIB [Erysipelotrichaceae bacterium RD49]|nr:PTS sugar transporter subunit IIB [Erysipelotrichaceae bacterium RD49]
MKKNILLVCNAGMSTSILVRNMQKAAEELGVDCHIEAKSLTAAKKELGNVDVILLGPQIGYELNNVKELAPNTPSAVIDMKEYGSMDGKKVLKTAYKLMKAAQKK